MRGGARGAGGRLPALRLAAAAAVVAALLLLGIGHDPKGERDLYGRTGRSTSSADARPPSANGG